MKNGIGSAVGYIDGHERVRGTINFVLNRELPGMLHCAIHESDQPHAYIRNIDVSHAASVPGVVGILTRDDFKLPGAPSPFFGPVVQDQPVVALDKVRYVGEPVAAIVAETPEAAAEAAALIIVEYEDLQGVFSLQDALQDDAPLVHEPNKEIDLSESFVHVVPVRELGGNVGNRFSLRHGDVEEGLARADRVFQHTFHCPAVAHVTMEPHVAIASFEAGRLNVWSSTQTPYSVRYELASMFRLPTSKVRVKVSPVGGGYGAKVYAKIEPLVSVMAWKTGRPVKLVLTRSQDFVNLTKHEASITLTTGVTSSGLLVARDVVAHFNAGAYSDISARLITNAGAATPGPYRIPNVRVESLAIFTNQAPAGAFRGFGVTQAAWAYESQVDIIAESLGIDPLEFRQKNLLHEGDTYATGEVLEGFELDRVLQDAANHIGWGEPCAPAENPRKRRGKGLSVIIKATVTPSTSTAALKLDRDGSVQVYTATVDMGQGSRTALTQIVAEELDISLDRIHIVDPDTDVTPFDQTTTSSRSTHSMGNALIRAAEDLKDEVRSAAAPIFAVDSEDVVVADGGVHPKGDQMAAISFEELFVESQAGSLMGKGSYITVGGLDQETGQGIGSVHWHQAAGAAEVEVDLDTGKIEILAYHSSVFAGVVVNPLSAELQVQGSAIFGIGQALFEEMSFNQGQLANANLSDSPIPALGDLPDRLSMSLLEDLALNDIHGIGETALPPVQPAVANAIARAVGARMHDAPFTPERVLRALDEGLTL